MTNAGVPEIPASSPTFESASICALWAFASSAALNLFMSRPSCSAYFSRAGRLRSERRVGVHGEGLVTPDELHLVAVRIGDLLHRRLHASAERALKVAKL